MRAIRAKWFAIIVALGMFSFGGLAWAQNAPPPLPMAVSGQVELPNGQPLTTSATIEALINGQVAGSLTFQSSQGKFGGSGLTPQLIIQGTASEVSTATPVSFAVLVNGSTFPANPVGSYTIEEPNNTASQGTGPVQWISGAVIPNLVLQMSGAPTAALTITSTALPQATVNQPYSATLSASGGQSPYSWSLANGSALPSGLTLSPSGVISGQPFTSGSFSFTVTVSDSESPPQTAQATLTLVVASSTTSSSPPPSTPSPLAVATSAVPAGIAGQSYTFSLTASGGTPPYHWELASTPTPPDWLQLTADGVLQGTPTQPGTFFFTATVSDSESPPVTASTSLVLIVLRPAASGISVTTKTANSSSGQPATATLTNNGSLVIEAEGESGSGTVGVGYYSGNPVSAAPPTPATNFYDVAVAPNSTFANLVVDFCNLQGGNQIDYWTGTAWEAVSPQQPTTIDGQSCLAVTFSSSSTPPLSSLTGTVFAAVQTTSSSQPTTPPSVPSGGGGGAPPSSSTSQVINAATGGTITVSGYNGATITATIPPNSLPETATVTLSPLQSVPQGVSTLSSSLQLVQLSVSSVSNQSPESYFLSPVTLAVAMSPVTQSSRAVFWNPLLGQWLPVSGVSVTGDTVSFPALRPGLYAVTGQAVVAPVQRLAGATRIGTAIAAAEAAYPAGAEAAILANAGAGAPSPDALSAAGLAGALHAPILLTAADQLSDGVLNALQALGTHTVYIVGGPAAISDAVVQALSAAGFNVVRQFEGQDRFQTAFLIYQYLYQQHLTQSTTAYIANGATMVDALAISPVADRQAAPTLLTAPGQTALSPDVVQWLSANGIQHVVLLGGTAAISSDLQNQLTALPNVTVERVGGATRNATATAIATHFFSNPAGVVITANGAAGSSFVDALSAGPFAGVYDFPLLLCNPTALPTSSQSYLQNQTALQTAWVMGGTAAIVSAVSQALQAYLH